LIRLDLSHSLGDVNLGVTFSITYIFRIKTENNILYTLILFADSIEQTDRSRRIMAAPIMLLLDQLVTPLIIGLKDRGEFRISTRLETTESIIIQMA